MTTTETAIALQLEQSRAIEKLEKCIYNAPLICYRTGSRWWLAQGCCNHWDCPRCGQSRARAEYGRIVEGVKAFDNAPLYFLTLTCRGADCTLDEAESQYMRWCNRVLTAMRTRCKRGGGVWTYALVTERQERGHPHSHAIISWMPEDTSEYTKGEHIIDDVYAQRDRLWSAWLHARIVDAGLGRQWDCTLVQSADAVARYISKYLFKDALQTTWPRHWRRVRYAQSWPKLPDIASEGDAFPVLNWADWMRVKLIGGIVYTKDMDIKHMAAARDVTNVFTKLNS